MAALRAAFGPPIVAADAVGELGVLCVTAPRPVVRSLLSAMGTTVPGPGRSLYAGLNLKF